MSEKGGVEWHRPGLTPRSEQPPGRRVRERGEYKNDGVLLPVHPRAKTGLWSET